MYTRRQLRGAIAMLGWSLAETGMAMTMTTTANALSAFLRGGGMGSDRRNDLEVTLENAGAQFGEAHWVNVPDVREN